MIKTRHWMLALAVCAPLLLTLGGPSSPAVAQVSAPRWIHTYFDPTTSREYIHWPRVKHATHYEVALTKVDPKGRPYACPCASVRGTRHKRTVRIGYREFPYQHERGSYRVSVTAYSAHNSATAMRRAKTITQGKPVRIYRDKHKDKPAESKINRCLKRGLAAGAVSGAISGGVALSTFWLPGVDLVTTTGAVSWTVGTFEGTFATCLVLPKSWGGG